MRYAVSLVRRLFVSGVRLSVCLGLRVGSDGMWTAHQCPTCKSLWPSDYAECVQCGVKCVAVNKRPMTVRQARSRESAILFERFYAEREAARDESKEPSPEELGREQAAKDWAEILELEARLRG